jgi:hypothetical protein
MLRQLTRTMLLATVLLGVCCATSSGQQTDSSEDMTTPPQTLAPELVLDGNTFADEGAPVVTEAEAMAGTCCTPWEYGNADLFYNFYVANNCGVPAQLYIAPRPVPAVVGHTYYTYQPLMPHEFTYPHHRTYRHWYDDGRGFNRTKVVWYCNPVVEAVKGVRSAIRLPR